MNRFGLLPFDSDPIDGYATANNGQTNERLDRDLNERHEYDEETNDEKAVRVE